MKIKIDCSFDKMIELGELIPHPKNNNRHPESQIKRLAKIIAYQGMRSPIVVSKLSGYITKGHGRLLALKELGVKKAPVNYQDYADVSQEYSDLTADNEIARWASIDMDSLLDNADLLKGIDLDVLGIMDFEIPNIDELWARPDNEKPSPMIPNVKIQENINDDEVMYNTIKVTRHGDVWLLGNHRLMCGSSVNNNDINKLINGNKIDMVFTDPPYGINEKTDRSFSAPSRKAKGGKFSKIIGDETTDVAYLFCSIWLSFEIPKYIIWGCNHFAHALPESPEWLAWDKRVEDKQRDNNSDIELAWVKSGKRSARIFRHLWKGMIKGSEQGEKRVHPTQKPIELAVWCFNEYEAGINIFDGFAGSGSTLIACEKTARRCFAMELDPDYCDVIITRWQRHTGLLAKNEFTGEMFPINNVGAI